MFRLRILGWNPALPVVLSRASQRPRFVPKYYAACSAAAFSSPSFTRVQPMEAMKRETSGESRLKKQKGRYVNVATPRTVLL